MCLIVISAQFVNLKAACIQTSTTFHPTTLSGLLAKLLILIDNKTNSK